MSFPIPIKRSTDTRGSPSAEVAPPRKKSNISRACVTCRRKRTRCDGQPRCSTCKLHDEECVYDKEKDGRRPASKQYVEALKRRVEQLEEDLAHGGNAGVSRTLSTSPTTSTQMPRTNTGAIHISGTGSVAHYGPTSTYAHLEDAAPAADELEGLPSLTLRWDDIDWSTLAWARILPPMIMLTPDLHRALLAVFFSHINTWCYWCDEAGFLSNLVDSARQPNPVRNAQYSPFLHNVILAVALLNAPELDPLPLSHPKTSMVFARHAYDMIMVEVLQPMTTTVRGLMLLGSYYFHNLQRNLGWLCEGMGARTAQIIGLNTSGDELVKKGAMSQQTKSHRDQTFWTVYVQDILWTFNVGRVPALTMEDFETPLPPIREQEDSLVWYNHLERFTPNLPQRDSAWASTCFHWTARLALIGNDIQRCLYRVRANSSETPDQSKARIELDMSTWLLDLPCPIRMEAWDDRIMPPHIANLHATFQYLRILLHRPSSFERNNLNEEAGSDSLIICQQSAEHIQGIFSRYPAMRHATFTLPNIAFTAGTTFLLLSTRNESTQAAVTEALKAVDQFIGWLGDMAWPASQIGKDILRRLKHEWKPPGNSPLQGLGSREDALQLLNNPNSDVVKLLRELGWNPPSVPSDPTLTQSQTLSTDAFLFDDQTFRSLGNINGGGDMGLDPFSAWCDWFPNIGDLDLPEQS